MPAEAPTKEETAQERKVREEQEAHERKLEEERQRDAEAHEKKEPPEGRLIDPAEYETEALALPKIDGEGVDKIAVKISGTVELDRVAEADVALVRGSKLGSTVTLMVECEAGPPVPTVERDADRYVKSLTLVRHLKVVSVYRAIVPDE